MMISEYFLHFLSDVGESSVLLAMIVVGCLYLSLLHRFREAGAVLLSFFISSVAIAILKLGFIGCTNGQHDIVSPSGHTALSISVYGVFSMLVFIRIKRRIRYVIPFITLALTSMIGASRVIQNLHSVNEVIVGAGVGLLTLCCVWYFLLYNKRDIVHARREPRLIRVYALPVLMMMTIFLMIGTKLPAEDIIKKMALLMKGQVDYCQD